MKLIITQTIQGVMKTMAADFYKQQSSMLREWMHNEELSKRGSEEKESIGMQHENIKMVDMYY